MPSFPVLKARQIDVLLVYRGFVCVRKKGSHKQYKHKDGRFTTLPFHPGRDISPFLLKQICKDIDISPQSFLSKK